MIQEVNIKHEDTVRNFEVRLPSNTARVTGITVTAKADDGLIGLVTFQSNAAEDMFLTTEVRESISVPFDEEPLEEPWITGNVPKKTIVSVGGDSVILHGAYRAARQKAFEMKVYVEYEETEKLDEQNSSL